MDKKIEKLKKQYLDTSVPLELQATGFDDVLARIKQSENAQKFYFSRMVAVVVIILVALTAFVGYAQAAQPGSPLYSIKKITAQAISTVTGQKEENVEKEINKIMNVPNPTETPTPSVSPTTTPVKTEKEGHTESETTTPSPFPSIKKSINGIGGEGERENENNVRGIHTQIDQNLPPTNHINRNDD